MSKKSFNDSFKEGMGGEMGKRTGSLLFVIIVAIIAGALGIKSCDTSGDVMQFNKTTNPPSNTR